MKKLLGIFLLICGTVTITLAQKISVAKVPSTVKTTFAKNRPGVKVNWEMEKTNFEAEKKGKDLLLDANGNPLKP